MEPENWLTLSIAGVSALASIAAALIAGRYAARARLAESEAARLRAAEERLAERKFKLYQPMLQALGNMLTPGNTTGLGQMEAALPDFMTFASVWASDDALEAFFRFRVGSGTTPPSEITFRLVSDFLVAARQDLSNLPTNVTGLEIFGMRINKLYDSPNIVEAFTLPFDELAEKHSWEIPWNPVNA